MNVPLAAEKLIYIVLQITAGVYYLMVANKKARVSN